MILMHITSHQKYKMTSLLLWQICAIKNDAVCLWVCTFAVKLVKGMGVRMVRLSLTAFPLRKGGNFAPSVFYVSVYVGNPGL